MKKIIAIVMALIFVVGAGAAVAVEEPTLLGAQNANKYKIHKMAALGNGLAISQSDPMDFELLKVGIAGVKINLVDEETELRVGVLYIGEDKYRLKDVEIGEGSTSANVYDGETLVGTISLDSYPKGDKEVWAGTLTINEVTYNAYVIQATRKVKPVEKAAKALSYCKNNPEKCRAAMKAVGNIICDPATNDCSDKIKTFCENNPEDARCRKLHFEFCAENLDDADCRAEIMEKCKENFNEEKCEGLGALYNRVAEKRPELAARAPAWVKSIRNRILNAQTPPTPPGADIGDTDGGE
ncbi:MAG: hypothetical protein KAS04_04775 [Candidatus Aenigmarchaeota archaeon]|nr:hypothetical protein [Candidatus Aenigmarchaeota archaeon]